MKPQVSISTAFSYDILLEDQMSLVAKAGFSHISLGMRPEHSGYLDPIRRQQLKDSLRLHSMKMDTIHHALTLDISDAISEVTGTIEAAADLGARCIVAHSSPFDCDSKGFDKRLQNLINTCNALLPVAQNNSIIIALENLRPGSATDLIRRALPELDSSTFGLCYDSSHDQMDGPRPFDLIDEFKGRLFTVHLSDCIKPFVDHVIPGEGFIDWSVMCDKLRSAHYTKPVFMEVMMQYSQFKEAKTFLHEAYKAGVYTWQLIHNNTGN